MLAIGDTIKIVEGPFYDFEGTIEEVRPSEAKGALRYQSSDARKSLSWIFLR